MRSDEIARRLRGARLPDSTEAEDRTAALARQQFGVPSNRRWWWPQARGLRIALLSGVGALAVTVVIALVAIGDGAQPGGGGGFGSFAAIAAEQPEGGFQRVDSESRLSYEVDSGATIDDTLELDLWVGDEERYERSTHTFVDGQRTKVGKSQYLFDRSLSLLCFESVLRPEDSKQAGCAPLSAIGPASEALWRGFEFSGDPSKLELEIDELVQRSRGRGDEPKVEPGPCEPKTPPFGVPVPRSLTTGVERQDLVTDLRAVDGANTDGGDFRYRLPGSELRFLILTNILSDPHASPELRAAAFEVLGGIEGASLAREEEDRLGREAAIISYDPPPPPGGDPTTRDEIYLDPTTSLPLELRTTVSSDDQELGSYSRLFKSWERVESLPAAAESLEQRLSGVAERCSQPSK